MTYQIFQYRLPMDGPPEDLNAWLAGQRVVAVTHHPASPGCGLPIGALTSQYLGNFMLDRFDCRMKTDGGPRRYLRYMDDVVMWGPPAALAGWRARAGDELAALGLEMKHGGEWNRCAQGLPFLGFVIYPDRIRLGREGRRRLRRKFGDLERRRRCGEVPDDEAQARAAALFAHALHGDDVGWRRMVLGFHGFGEAPEPQSRHPRRLLEQPRQELPLREPQQEEARQPQQEPGLPGLSVPRHGGAMPPDDAPSRARLPRAETTDKPPPHAETPRGARRKGCGGAPGGKETSDG